MGVLWRGAAPLEGRSNALMKQRFKLATGAIAKVQEAFEEEKGSAISKAAVLRMVT